MTTEKYHHSGDCRTCKGKGNCTEMCELLEINLLRLDPEPEPFHKGVIVIGTPYTASSF